MANIWSSTFSIINRSYFWCISSYKSFKNSTSRGSSKVKILAFVALFTACTIGGEESQGVDFGEWDKNFDLLSWIDKYISLLSPNGSIIIFNSYRNLSYIIERLELNNIEIKDILVWQKSNPMPRNRDRRYVQDMEFAIWGVNKNSKWVFNRPSNKPYLRSFFQSSIVSGIERTEHPTQKSLKIMQEIIKIHTNKGETVLDCFMGSGTTGVACQKLGRNFIGIEKDKKYFDIAKSRMIL